jgi:hypothetical protein
MYFTTTVRLSTDESPALPLTGVKVALYDKDLFSPDDLLGTTTTDENGEARFQFSSEDYVDLDDRARGVFPDLYAVVYGQGEERVISTRSEALENSAPKYISVRIARDVANQYHLLPGGA